MQAELRILAGAEPGLIEHWRLEGHRRAMASGQVPRT